MGCLFCRNDKFGIISIAKPDSQHLELLVSVFPLLGASSSNYAFSLDGLPGRPFEPIFTYECEKISASCQECRDRILTLQATEHQLADPPW